VLGLFLQKKRIKLWPYNGPVILKESSFDGSSGEIFVIDRWCLVGAFQFDEAGTRPFLQTLSGTFFEYDTYKILSKALVARKVNVEVVSRHALESILDIGV
jgi:hypothetical protein